MKKLNNKYCLKTHKEERKKKIKKYKKNREQRKQGAGRTVYIE